MNRLYHSAIFYPDEITAIEEMTDGIAKNGENAKALILPHGDLRKLYTLYRESFRFIPDSINHVIILAPLHSDFLIEDKEEIAAEGGCGSIETFYGGLNIKSLGLKVNEAYSEEEAAPELVLPFIKCLLPEADISIVYAKVDTSEKSKRFSTMLRKWQNQDTFFIISSNLTGKLKKDEVKTARENASEYITGKTHLLDAQNKHLIDICGAGIIDSFNRVNDGTWNLIGFSDNDTITGHGAFYRK